MAFRELTADELELLTEEQRKVYEEELDIYQQRVRFVEQLERTENMQLEPFEPTLKRIPAVKKAPEKQFAQQEHRVQKVTVAKKKLPRTLAVSIDPIGNPEIPKFSTPDMPRMDGIQKIESQKPVVPMGRKLRLPEAKAMPAQPVKADVLGLEGPKIPAVNARKPMAVSADVPAVAKPQLVQTVSAKPVDLQAVNTPAVSVRKPAAPVIAAPVNAINPTLPAAIKQPAAPVVAAAAYEETKPELPAVSVKVRQVKAHRIAAPQVSALPDVPSYRPAEVAFRQPQIQKPTAVSVKKALIPETGNIQASTVIPEVAIAAAPKARVSEPKAPKIGVPDVSGSVAPIQSVMEAMAAAVKNSNPARSVSVQAIRESAQRGVNPIATPAPVTVPDPYSNALVKAMLRTAPNENKEGAHA